MPYISVLCSRVRDSSLFTDYHVPVLHLMILLAASVCLLALKAYGQGGLTQSFFPASIPLAVRTPYLSTWHNATSGQLPLSSSSPVFWTQQVCSHYTDFPSCPLLKHDLGDYGVDWQHQGGQHLLFLARSWCPAKRPERHDTGHERADYSNSIHIRDGGRPDECYCYISVPYRGELIYRFCPPSIYLSCASLWIDRKSVV